jgi:hypothetical protein
MALNLLCRLFGMHSFVVHGQNSRQPIYRCTRCGTERPFEPLESEKFFKPGGGASPF